jgi:hypothetical protein
MVAAQRGQVSIRRLDAALSVTGSDRIHRRGAQPGIAGIAQLPAWAEAHRGVLRASLTLFGSLQSADTSSSNMNVRRSIV